MRRQDMRVAVLIIVIAATCVAGSASRGGAAPADVVTQGTIDALRADGITISVAGTGAGTGVTQIKFTATTLVLTRQPATLAVIEPGNAIGVAAKRMADGSLSAVAINIFPPELWGRVREGQFPMTSGDIMTNAVVMRHVDRVEGRTLYLKYKDGATAIIVPADTPVQRVTVAQGP
jgi:hypothetical protein